MKKISFLFVLLSLTVSAQVGINTVEPSHQLHVVPELGDNPVRFEGMQDSNSSTDKVVVATSTGVLKTKVKQRKAEVLLDVHNFVPSNTTLSVSSSTSVQYGELKVREFTFKVERLAMVTVSYSLAANLSSSSAGSLINDGVGRSYQTFLRYSDLGTQNLYGYDASFFSQASGTSMGITGNLVNSSTHTRILPPGSYTVSMYGVLFKGTNAVSTYIDFGSGQDDFQVSAVYLD